MLGLDPDPGDLWAGGSATEEAGGELTPRDLAGRAVLEHCCRLIDATAQACVAVKPQLARFEVLGAVGREVLGEVVSYAHQAGLLVIADGKRGDIDVTARAYASSLMGGLETPFGHLEGLGADLVTVNPLMGTDAVEPFVQEALRMGAGVLVLVRTSNPGAADFEDLDLAGGGGGRLWERVAGMVDELGGAKVGNGGLSDVGAVIGATEPGHLRRARQLMGSAPFLLPGIGAQGGRVEDLSAAFEPGRAGGLVSASRSIANAHRANGGEPAAAAAAEAERLREAAWALSDEIVRAG